MYPLGHVGMALLFVAPAMLVLSRRRYYALVASLALATALLPDLDGPLPLTHHHGGTHTVAFALGFSLTVGVALATASVYASWLALRFSSVPAFRPRTAFAAVLTRSHGRLAVVKSSG